MTLANGTKLDAYEILAPLGGLARSLTAHPTGSMTDSPTLSGLPTASASPSTRDLRSGVSKGLLPSGTVATAFDWPCRITRDNRILTFQHDSAEGDVWLMSLE